MRTMCYKDHVLQGLCIIRNMRYKAHAVMPKTAGRTRGQTQANSTRR